MFIYFSFIYFFLLCWRWPHLVCVSNRSNALRWSNDILYDFLELYFKIFYGPAYIIRQLLWFFCNDFFTTGEDGWRIDIVLGICSIKEKYFNISREKTKMNDIHLHHFFPDVLTDGYNSEHVFRYHKRSNKTSRAMTSHLQQIHHWVIKKQCFSLCESTSWD